MGIAFVDVSGLDWDEEKPTVVHTPAFNFVEFEPAPEPLFIDVELPDAWDHSMEIDLLFLEPDLG
jgi:hypothetical protein